HEYCNLKINLASLFFFQAEDGIRDGHVTGVQTCALPICADMVFFTGGDEDHVRTFEDLLDLVPMFGRCSLADIRVRTCAEAARRSEERRVGKEWRARRSKSNEE